MAEKRAARRRVRDQEERRLEQAGKLRQHREQQEAAFQLALRQAEEEDRQEADGGENDNDGSIKDRGGSGSAVARLLRSRRREERERAEDPPWWRFREGRFLAATLKPKTVIPEDWPPPVEVSVLVGRDAQRRKYIHIYICMCLKTNVEF